MRWRIDGNDVTDTAKAGGIPRRGMAYRPEEETTPTRPLAPRRQKIALES